MMMSGALLTPFSARIAERLGARLLIAGGLVLMTAGLVVLAVVPATTPVWALALLMVLVGWPVEHHVSELRVDRNASSENYLNVRLAESVANPAVSEAKSAAAPGTRAGRPPGSGPPRARDRRRGAARS